MIILGMILFGGGYLFSFLEYRIRRKIYTATKDGECGLTEYEMWSRAGQFQKWKKLRYMSAHHSDESMRVYALRALRFETGFYSLAVSGMLLMVIGAATRH